ncbi:MAG: DsbA family protein [Pseudomonadota bacterium]
MTKTITYFHSLSSPWAYLGGPRFHQIVEKHQAEVVLRPTTILRENGGIPLRSRPDPRQAYHAVELDRWRKLLNMPLVLKPKHYPTDPRYSARMVIAADRSGLDALKLSHALLHALWSEEKDVKEASVRIGVADSLGMDGKRLQEMSETPEIIEAWEESHNEAIAAGAFGTPTYVFQGVLFWGQDRLDFLDEALSET